MRPARGSTWSSGASGSWSSAAASAGWPPRWPSGAPATRSRCSSATRCRRDRRRRGGLRRRAAGRTAGPPDPRLPRPPRGRAARSASPTCSTTCRAVGCTTMPTTRDLGEPQPGDEDLAVLIVRRTTFEWVLRTAVVGRARRRAPHRRRRRRARRRRPRRRPAHRVVDRRPPRRRHGASTPTSSSPPPAAAARCRPGWASVGVDVPETDPRERPRCTCRAGTACPPASTSPLDPKLGGDLGFVKYLAVPGDGGTLSVTLAVRTDDGELRAALADPERLRARLPAAPRPRPVLRRRPPRAARRRAPDGRPAQPAPPLRRRRRPARPSLGVPRRRRRPHVHQPALRPGLLARARAGDAARRRPRRPPRRPGRPGDRLRGRLPAARSSPGSTRRCRWTRAGADPAGFAGAGAAPSPQAKPDGRACSWPPQTDPVIGRALTRFWNLLAHAGRPRRRPGHRGADAEVMADPDAYPVAAPRGPDPRRAARRAHRLDPSPQIGGLAQ